eukprot:gb/GEZN01005051.1/.p2 GENE.gb/GEZN01005051.1/~~gb/GEZN01005051.1/.p2  ORF type:complete len:138 (+),score=26.28 gb/GEZN01005051.1/:1080-1493(+)
MGKQRNLTFQIGRVCLVNYGEYAGKLCVLVDVMNAARALVDGPTTGVPRHEIPIKRLSLTPLTVKIGPGAKCGALTAALAKAKTVEEFQKTGWAKKIQNTELRKNLGDFDRFKLMLLRKKKSKIIRAEVKKLKKAAK